MHGVPRRGRRRIQQTDHRRGRGLHRVGLAGRASGEELGGVLIARVDPAAIDGGEVRVGAGDVVEDGAGGDARVVGAQAPQRELGVGTVDGGFVARTPVPRAPDIGMRSLNRHADLGGAVGEVRGEKLPFRSHHTHGPVVPVVEEAETGGVRHGRPYEPGGRRPKGHRAGLTDRGSLLKEGDDDTEELLVGVVEDRLVEISAAVSRCTRIPVSYLPVLLCSPCRGFLGAQQSATDPQLAPTPPMSRSHAGL
jgi:hypothetical protein